MPQIGYKAVTIKDEAYKIAKQEASREQVSIGEIFSRAINRYVNKRLELEERVKTVLEVMDKTENGEARV